MCIVLSKKNDRPKHNISVTFIIMVINKVVHKLCVQDCELCLKASKCVVKECLDSPRGNFLRNILFSLKIKFQYLQG